MDTRTKEKFCELNKLFTKHNKELRLVGGAVRDILQDKNPDDLDFCTNATPDEMMSWYAEDGWKVRPTGLQHGTVTFVKHLMLPMMSSDGQTTNYVSIGEQAFEVTTLRRDIKCDGRHAEVEFTDDWKQDAARRDFTINAMSMDIDGNVYDYFNGLEDLKNRKVRFVGNVENRIKEDALRMLRYFRFVASFDEVDNESFTETINIFRNNRSLIKNITVERIWNEYTKVCKKYPKNVDFFLLNLEISGLNDFLKFPRYVSAFNTNNKYYSKFPVLPLALKTNSKEKGQEFYKRYKLSRIERKQYDFFVEYANILNFNIIQDLIESKIDREWIAALCHSMLRPELEHCAKTLPDYVFPMQAQHLLDEFPQLTEGRKLSNIHKKLHEKWKNSRYNLTYNELVKICSNEML